MFNQKQPSANTHTHTYIHKRHEPIAQILHTFSAPKKREGSPAALGLPLLNDVLSLTRFLQQIKAFNVDSFTSRKKKTNKTFLLSYPVQLCQIQLISLSNIRKFNVVLFCFFSLIHNFFSLSIFFFFFFWFTLSHPLACLPFSFYSAINPGPTLSLLYDVTCAQFRPYLSCRFVPQETPEKGVS